MFDGNYHSEGELPRGTHVDLEQAVKAISAILPRC
jgi:hypothetical protein